jgi:hypothetical protein
MDARRFATLTRTFAAPPRLSASRPRQVRPNPAGLTLLILAMVLGVGSAVSYVLIARESARQAETRRLLTTAATTTEGAVSRLWENGDDRRRVEYRFEVGARAYVGRARVSDAVRRTLQVGSPLVVRYVPADPRVNDLGGSRRSGLPALIAPIVSIVLLIAGGLCAYGVSRQRELLAEGRVAPGVVTTVRKSHSGDGKLIEFEFQTLSGAIQRGTSTHASKPPAVGTLVCVVYDPDRPERHAVYPFSLVKPAT